MKLKKITAILMSALFVFSAVPTYASDKTVYIETVDDLIELAENCTLDSWSRDVTVMLKNNINVKGSGFTQIPTFGGTFEGNGYTVSGMDINANEPVQGFFRYIQEGGTVNDLTVKGDITEDTGKTTFGGVVGINKGSVINCSFYGDIDGETSIGGIAGINEASGRIGNCISEGNIKGEKYTGGIVGKNYGEVLRCVNRSKVNTTSEEESISITDISIDDINPLASEDANPLKGHTDTGGIAGYTTGVIKSCQNYGEIGYQHIGYNVGGIAGRQSGYISGCRNNAQVSGRKDVGGIVGQAEPYVLIRYGSDALQRLDDALKEMQSLVNGMLDDIDVTTDDVSGRITSISDYADAARDSSKEIIDQTSDYMDDIRDFANDNIDKINDVSADITDTFDRLVPVIDDMLEASELIENAMDSLEDVAKGIKELGDISGEMADKIEKALEKLKEDRESVSSALDKIKTDADTITAAAVSGDEEAIRKGFGNLNVGLDELSQALADRRDHTAELKEAVESIDNLPITEEEKAQITESLGNMSEYTGQMSDEAKKMADTLLGLDSNIDIESLYETLKELSDMLEKFNQSFKNYTEMLESIKEMLEGLKDISKDVSDSLKKIAKGFSNALGDMDEATDSIYSALKRTKKIVKRLADKGPVEFSTLDNDYHLDTDDLYSSLSEMSNQISSLNTELKNSSDIITADLRAINNQFSKIMDIVIDALTEDEDKDISDVVDDTSDTDIYKSTEGKIESCVNMGKIEADLNVGGVAGSMAIEYDLDPEDDISSVGRKSIDFRFETKAVLLDCQNYGSITSKKDYVGGVVGRMDLGTAAECGGYGYVSSSSGDYVGGIAGLSAATIRDSYSKCILSGESYIGGIAGDANKVENCYSIIDVEDGIGRIGAIAGDAEELDDISGNGFINRGIAGISGISYEGKAEPMEYEAMKAVSILPDDFLEFTLKFKANGSTVETIPFTFGEDLSSIEFPEVPQKDGYFATWPDTDLSCMTFSTVIEAEYKPLADVLTSDETGENTVKPIALAEGQFTEDDKVSAQYTEAESVPAGLFTSGGGKTVEVSIHSDSIGDDTVSSLRLLKPDEDSKAKVWQLRDGKWHKVSTEDNGSYVITGIKGKEGTYYIVSRGSMIKEYVTAVAVAAIAVATVAAFIKKKKK